MKRLRYLILVSAVVAAALWLAASTLAQTAPPSSPQLTTDQQKQLDQLRQLDQQLQKDRDAMHAAMTEYGWDSDQVDAAQQQLEQDRMQYRKLRRSLKAAGVQVPPPTGFGAGPGGPGPGMAPGGGGGMRGGRGHHRGGGMCDCPCAM